MKVKPLPSVTKSKWISLFDGKTLKGWTQRNGTATYKVEDGGVIVGTTVEGSPNSFLCTDELYTDFELEFEVKVDNQVEPRILPGMFARVRVPVITLDQALLVPRDALLEDNRGTHIYVVDLSTQTARRRNLVLGDVGPEEAVVSEGLSPGEIIVVSGQERLQDGAPVEWAASASGSPPGKSRKTAIEKR